MMKTTLQDFLNQLSLEHEMKEAMDTVSTMMSRYQQEGVFEIVKEAPASAISKIYYLFKDRDKNHEFYEDSEIATMYYLERIFKLVAKGYEELEELIHE